MESLQLDPQRDIRRVAVRNRLGETIDGNKQGNKSNKRIVIRSSAMHEVLRVAVLVVWRSLPLCRYDSVPFLLFNQHNSTTRMETLRENRITANCAYLMMMIFFPLLIAPKIIFFSNALSPLLVRLAQPGKCGKKENFPNDKVFVSPQNKFSGDKIWAFPHLPTEFSWGRFCCCRCRCLMSKQFGCRRLWPLSLTSHLYSYEWERQKKTFSFCS